MIAIKSKVLIWVVLFQFIMLSDICCSQTPIMGWSSWNTYRININDSLIMKQADAMVNLGLQTKGYQFINIDDGFFGHRDSTGHLHTHAERFPNGVKHVADYIHGKGLKAGIYSDAGANTCGSIWDADQNGVEVGLYGNEEKDADLFFNQWGFDFIKIDYCGAGQLLNLEEEQRYTAIRNAIDKVANQPIAINVCRWAFPGTWVMNQADSWRISADITPSWESIRYIIGKNLYLSAYARNGRFNDMDMLEIGRGLPSNIEQLHFGMWCIMSSPLLIGCDLTTIPEASLQLLKNEELIALNQDVLKLQPDVVQHKDGTYVLVKDIIKNHGKKRAVAFYNPTNDDTEISIDLSKLELAGKVKVRDVIAGNDLPTVTGKLHATVEARSAEIFVLTAETRLEPTHYEAEWAYLNHFNDLGKNDRIVQPKPILGASNGMMVTHLGGDVDNYAEWDRVYSQKGGKYELTIHYIPFEQSKTEISGRRLEVMVNGTSIVLKPGNNTDLPINTISTPIELRAGYNTIRMGSSFTWAPNIDCFQLKKIN